MTGLLVSVRNAEEAEIALEGGADVIDVKEPKRGALGAADSEVWREILQVVAGRAIVSAEMGELMEEGIRDRARQTVGFRFAKIGLAGCEGERGWKEKWACDIEGLPAGVCAVPVTYADRKPARSPAISEV